MSELGDSLELLHGGSGRVTTLAGTLLAWRDEERGVRAVEAFRVLHPDRSIAVLHRYGKGEPEPLRQYEQRTRVHYRAPGRYRLRLEANSYAHRPHEILEVCDGEREWTYVAAEREAWVQAPGCPEIFDLVDPSWLAAACTLSVHGRTTYEGRPAVELHGQPRQERRGLHLRHVGPGTEELRAVVDAETGLLLSLASHFDELFRFTPPSGVRIDDLQSRKERLPQKVTDRVRFGLHLIRRELDRRFRTGRGSSRP